MNLYNMYIYPIKIHMRKLELKKKKKVQERFYGKTLSEYIYDLKF